ncbi:MULTISPECIES: LapA family protein [Bacillaceae]|uniref:DUF1049 domain-containing protein n=1 Tax=Evansella alkalicola TaxID=745819 RepID=A0ABS6JQ44_9BACI|nr:MULTISPECIES: lipopolysaccharide assembly protein LapA domain-containing protein [Bacillaceae]MBU9720686.1 DUF1049 domain-containing protein [Bacillus alkalicola]
MRGQWGLIIGIIVVLIIAVFSVVNVDPVEVNYIFGQAEWPLVLVIIFSVLMGGIIVGSVGMYKIYLLQKEIKTLTRRLEEKGASPSTSALASDQKNSKDARNKKDLAVKDSNTKQKQK